MCLCQDGSGYSLCVALVLAHLCMGVCVCVCIRVCVCVVNVIHNGDE